MNPQNDSDNLLDKIKDAAQETIEDLKEAMTPKSIQEWLAGFKARPSKLVPQGKASRHSPFTKPKRKKLSGKERRRRAAQSRKDKKK